MSVQQAVQHAEFACDDIIVPWSRKYGQHWKCKTDKKESKCGYRAIMVDAYGYRSSFDASPQALTKHGLMRVPKYDQSEVFVDLGVPRVVP